MKNTMGKHFNPAESEQHLYSWWMRNGYFHADDRQELEEIYAYLDEINPRQVETQSYRPLKELYTWPLAAGMLLSLFYIMFLEIRLHVNNRKIGEPRIQGEAS